MPTAAATRQHACCYCSFLRENPRVSILKSFMATLPIVKVQRLYRQISDLLIQKFKSREFEPGTALPAERDLAQQLGVSRSSVREALIALEIAGWVDIKTGHGVFVCDRSPQSAASNQPGSASVEELLKARELIEGETASLAAENASEEQLVRLAAIMDAMNGLSEKKIPFLTLDEQFHQLIAEMANNFVFAEFVSTLWNNQRYDQLFVSFENHYGNDESEVWNVDHRAICAAITAKDPLRAKAAMQGHIRHVHASFFAGEA